MTVGGAGGIAGLMDYFNRELVNTMLHLRVDNTASLGRDHIERAATRLSVRMKDGKPTGEYEDFMTEFIVDNNSVWGRPAGVAISRDGALLVSDDANGTIFRVTRK